MIGGIDRSFNTKYLFEIPDDIRRIILKNYCISYVLYPRWAKEDFPYNVELVNYRKSNIPVFENSKYIIFSFY